MTNPKAFGVMRDIDGYTPIAGRTNNGEVCHRTKLRSAINVSVFDASRGKTVVDDFTTAKKYFPEQYEFVKGRRQQLENTLNELLDYKGGSFLEIGLGPKVRIERANARHVN